MDNALLLLIVVVVMAIAFDFINGFHDAANAIATVVSTGVLPMRTAVILAGIANFGGALAGTEVAKTVAAGFADANLVTQGVVLAALIGACVWNLLTWWWGIPSSSSHALIGGLAGAVIGHAGWNAFNWTTLYKKVLLPLVGSPLTGFAVALLLMVGLFWLIQGVRSSTVNYVSRKMQLVSAMGMAFSHGSNDAQKSMGIITLAVTAFAADHAGVLPTWVLPAEAGKVPYWAVLACATAIGLGTAAGGKKIIETMGTKIFRISPIHGFAAETAGSLIILVASLKGIPLSTTHCINACLMGAGASKRLSAVRWQVTGRIVTAWIVTLPFSAAIAWVAVKLIGG